MQRIYERKPRQIRWSRVRPVAEVEQINGPRGRIRPDSTTHGTVQGIPFNGEYPYRRTLVIPADLVPVVGNRLLRRASVFSGKLICHSRQANLAKNLLTRFYRAVSGRRILG
jgi:hypothetical protein